MLDTSGGSTIILYFLGIGVILLFWGIALFDPSMGRFTAAAVITVIIGALLFAFGD